MTPELGNISTSFGASFQKRFRGHLNFGDGRGSFLRILTQVRTQVITSTCCDRKTHARQNFGPKSTVSLQVVTTSSLHI